MTQRCSKCGTEKPDSEFSVDRTCVRGFQYRCKACDKVSRAIYRASHRERGLAYTLEWRKNNPVRAAAARARAYRTSRDKWPARYMAKDAIKIAVRNGRLIPQPCFCCGARAEAHHASYAPEMRLAVTWLCRTHHRQLHKEASP